MIMSWCWHEWGWSQSTHTNVTRWSQLTSTQLPLREPSEPDLPWEPVWAPSHNTDHWWAQRQTADSADTVPLINAEVFIDNYRIRILIHFQTETSTRLNISQLQLHIRSRNFHPLKHSLLVSISLLDFFPSFNVSQAKEWSYLRFYLNVLTKCD